MRHVSSYLVSVTAGVLTLFAIATLSLGLQQLDGPGHLIVVIFLFIVIWILCAVTATLPCALLSFIARKYDGAANWMIYTGVAVAFGILLGCAVVGLTSSFSWYTDGEDAPGPTVIQQMEREWSAFAISGAVAGFTYWALAGRRRRRTSASR